MNDDIIDVLYVLTTAYFINSLVKLLKVTNNIHSEPTESIYKNHEIFLPIYDNNKRLALSYIPSERKLQNNTIRNRRKVNK